MKKFLVSLFVLSVSIFTSSGVIAAPTKVTWHGHAAFEIVTPRGSVLMVDPWLNNPKNPHAGEGKDPVSGVTKCDYILISHGHSDHVGDAVALGKQSGARLVSSFELGSNMAKVQGYPKDQMGYDTLMNMGGEITIANGEVKIFMTPAVHSSGMSNPKAKDNEPDLVYGGNPVGFLIQIENGPNIYHTGDTAYFEDMALIPEIAEIDLALLNFGGHFGMEPAMAARAGKTVKAKMVVPHHFATMPILTQDEDIIETELRKQKLKHRILKPGQTLTYDGARLRK